MIVVEFGILGTPQNWANWTPNRMALYAKKKEWLETTIILGRMARNSAGVPIAIFGHPLRYISITQYRIRFLDKDGLFISGKPIVDGLKTELRRKVGKTFEKYPGAGLIFDDDPTHCDWDVKQEKATGTPQIKIRIEIPESS